MRLNRHTRLLLQQAAQHERRSIASLIDKIITDYLKNEGYLKRSDRIEDQRSGCRKTTMLPAIAMQDPATGH